MKQVIISIVVSAGMLCTTFFCIIIPAAKNKAWQDGYTVAKILYSNNTSSSPLNNYFKHKKNSMPLSDSDITELMYAQLNSQLMIEEARYKIQFDMAKNYNKHMSFMTVETAAVITELKRQIDIVGNKGYKALEK